MKCPKCGYTTFDDLPVCKKCNYPFASGGKVLSVSPSSHGEEWPVQGPARTKESESAKPPGLSAALESIGRSLREIDSGPSSEETGERGEVGGDRQSELMGERNFLPREDWATKPNHGVREWQVREWKGRAGFWLRALAFAIDNIVVNLLSVLVLLMGTLAVHLAGGGQAGPSVLSSTAVIVEEPRYAMLFYLMTIAMTAAYFTYFHGSTGQTLGKMVCGLKVVRTDGRRLGYARGLLRWFGYLLSAIILYMGFLWVIFDRGKQAWHDKLVGSCVMRK